MLARSRSPQKIYRRFGYVELLYLHDCETALRLEGDFVSDEVPEGVLGNLVGIPAI